MKKRDQLALSLIFLVILVLNSSTTNAEAVTYKVELKTGYITLRERDMFEFRWKDMTNRIMIRGINLEKGIVELTEFIQGAETPFYTSISKIINNQLDFDKDDEIDLIIRLYDIKEDEATLFLETPVPSKEPGSFFLGMSTKGMAITLGIIIMGSLIYMLFRKRNAIS